MFCFFFLQQTCDYYKLVVQGADLRGAAGGLTGTGTVEIKVLDINDNKPILEKSEVRHMAHPVHTGNG